MNGIQQLFISLIRLALLREPMDGPILLSTRQWKQLYGLSTAQFLSVLAYSELSRLGNNMPKKIKAGWKSDVDYHLARFDAQLMGLTHISQFLEDHGIRTMILKGLGLALLYPVPQARECSDVDIFCFGEFERVNSLLEDTGLISGIVEENDKHCSFSFDGINIENHRHFCENVNKASAIFEEQISRLSKTKCRTDSRVPGILFPGPQMGALHMTIHTLSHLAWSGITLRHLLDFGLFFQRYNDELDRESIVKIWKDAGIADAAFSLCTLCGSLLGIDTGMIEGKSTDFRNTADLILQVILTPCLPSSSAWNPITKIYRKYKRYRIRYVMHRIVYSEPFPDSFWKSFSILKKWT